jgi:excisionase family DNA binding protein
VPPPDIPPSYERELALSLRFADVALASVRSNGSGPSLPADAVWLLEYWSLREPVTAADCPRVMHVVSAGVRVAVRKMAAEKPRATPPAQPAQHVVGSGEGRPWLTTQDAAVRLGIGYGAVRAAIARGRLRAARHRDGWHLTEADVDEYARSRA